MRPGENGRRWMATGAGGRDIKQGYSRDSEMTRTRTFTSRSQTGFFSVVEGLKFVTGARGGEELGLGGLCLCISICDIKPTPPWPWSQDRACAWSGRTEK